MNQVLNSRQKAGFANADFSRRDFHRIASLLTAGRPCVLQRGGAGAARQARRRRTDAVKIDANENPMGPCARRRGDPRHGAEGRPVSHGESSKMAAALAEQEGLGPGYVQPFAGSSDALHRTILSFCGKDRRISSEAPAMRRAAAAAQFVGASAIGVPLTEGSSRPRRPEDGRRPPDPRRVLHLHPNNPTGTVTPRPEIEWLVNHKPAGSLVLLDEAYISFLDARRKVVLSGGGRQGPDRSSHFSNFMEWPGCGRRRTGPARPAA